MSHFKDHRPIRVLGFKIWGPPLSWRISRGDANRGGWVFTLTLGTGGGCRWIDFPGHSMNCAHRFRMRLYIAGRSLQIGHWCNDYRWRRDGSRRARPPLYLRRWAFSFFARGADNQICPANSYEIPSERRA